MKRWLNWSINDTVKYLWKELDCRFMSRIFMIVIVDRACLSFYWLNDLNHQRKLFNIPIRDTQLINFWRLEIQASPLSLSRPTLTWITNRNRTIFLYAINKIRPIVRILFFGKGNEKLSSRCFHPSKPNAPSDWDKNDRAGIRICSFLSNASHNPGRLLVGSIRGYWRKYPIF